MAERQVLEWMERYELRSTRETHEGWAIIHIDSKGFLGVVSDFGNYAYHWSAFEGCFRRFLAQLEADYLYGKLATTRSIYDGCATERAIKAHICSQRRSQQWSVGRAREEWDLLKEHEIDHDKSDGFSCWYEDTSIDDAAEFYQTRPEPQCMAFCEKVWPRFVQAMNEGRTVPLQSEAS